MAVSEHEQITEVKEQDRHDQASESRDVEARLTRKARMKLLWPVMACGAGLFSDGYLNGIIGPINTIFEVLYREEYAGSEARRTIPAITFAGTVLGMLIFGYTSDRYSRKRSLVASTVILIIFAALSASAYGKSVHGMLVALAVFRFLLGVGIGGEYPAGSVGCAESTNELASGARNRWFILFTNVQIDLGLLAASLVPMAVVAALSERHLRAAWRVCAGIGVIPPVALVCARARLSEPEAFQKGAIRKQPIRLSLRFYWRRLLLVSGIWCVYDFSAYAFGIYASSIVAGVLGDGPLWKSFGWSALIAFFHMPGCVLGSFLADVPALGPKRVLGYGAIAQAAVGFIMAGCYGALSRKENIAGFVVMYGLFLALGEAGPGNNIGLIASKTTATAVRGQYYGIAAAVGKLGAFAGSYLFPVIQDRAPTPLRRGQDPFFVASSLAVAAGLVAIFCLPEISQEAVEEEDARFKQYLAENGFDLSQMGLREQGQKG